jgi:hypothetical protein
MNNATATIGEQAARSIIAESRRLALSQCKDMEEREEFLKQVYECEQLINQFIRAHLSDDPTTQSNVIDMHLLNMGKQLQENFKVLAQNIKRALIQRVADDFIDIHNPIKKLADVVLNQSRKAGKVNIFF